MRKKTPNTRFEERVHGVDREILDQRQKLQALDEMFADSEENPYLFLQKWVSPLTDAGMSMDDAVNFLIESHIHPN